MKVSDTKLKAFLNKEHDKPFELSDRDSLGVRVSKKGKIAWQYRYRFEKTAQRITLGHYPDMSIKKAREEIPVLQGMIFRGENPKLLWNANSSANDNEKPNLIEVIEIWFNSVGEEKYKGTTFDNYFSTIGKWIYNTPKREQDLSELWVKKYLMMPFDNIRNAQWMDYFDWICREGSPVTAGSVLKLIKTAITWAIKREIVNNSNILLFKVSDVGRAPQMGERTPSADEIAKFWIEIEKSKALPQTKISLQMIILSGGRNTAVRTAKWNDFDFEKRIWTIPSPKDRKKFKRVGSHIDDIVTQRPERHPISNKMAELLSKLGDIYGREGYVFPGEKTNKEISIHAIDRYCARISAKLFAEQGISKIKPHDFRRSISSILSEKDVKWLAITEKILGHKLKGTMAHYNKADYLAQQLEAYEIYWEEIKSNFIR